MRVVQTTLTEAQHKLLEEYAKRNSKSIKEVVRDAVARTLEGGVDPRDPIFSAPAVSARTGKEDRGSIRHDEFLYGEGA